MLHARPDYNRIQDPANLIPNNEPVFLLRANDAAAPAIVEAWAGMAEGMGAKANIVNMAREHAKLMRQWQANHGSKTPDLKETAIDHHAALVVKKFKWLIIRFVERLKNGEFDGYDFLNKNSLKCSFSKILFLDAMTHGGSIVFVDYIANMSENEFLILKKEIQLAYADNGCGACGDGCNGGECRVIKESPPCVVLDLAIGKDVSTVTVINQLNLAKDISQVIENANDDFFEKIKSLIAKHKERKISFKHLELVSFSESQKQFFNAFDDKNKPEFLKKWPDLINCTFLFLGESPSEKFKGHGYFIPITGLDGRVPHIFDCHISCFVPL